MVDAARQMLDELMGRNRNLHPSEATRKVHWDDPDYCQYYVVRFCPHDLFINTRADLGPCTRLHDDEAKQMYEEARPNLRKRQYEDEFLRFCNLMLNDVDRKIQKGKQRLQLMQRDQPLGNVHLSRYQEQLNNLNARIKKLLSEAEEAGIRGDVDQAQDLMTLCDQLKDERDTLIAQHDSSTLPKPESAPSVVTERSDNSNDGMSQKSDSGDGDKKPTNWLQDITISTEKQMEVCEICGAFLIVGDAQQRIEDHLMGKQHLGYTKLRKAVEEIQEKRQKDREDEESKRSEERTQRRDVNQQDRRSYRDRDQRESRDRGLREQRDRDHRDREYRGDRDNRDNRDRFYREQQRNSRDYNGDRHRDNYRNYKGQYNRRGDDRNYNYRSNHHTNRDRKSRSRSRSRY